MKMLKKCAIPCLIVFLSLCFGQTAFAAKSLSLGTAGVSNEGDDATRTAVLDVTLKGGASDVNGLAFTLVYNQDVLTFEGLVKHSMDIYDGAGYDSGNPPTADTIADTLFYMFNDNAEQGVVKIAAAAADFFTTDTSADFVPFKVKFKAKSGSGAGSYPIEIQKTTIGPDTAANAGYATATALEAAAGLDPAKDPSTAQTYSVAFFSGQIAVVSPTTTTTTTTTTIPPTTTTTTTVPPTTTTTTTIPPTTTTTVPTTTTTTVPPTTTTTTTNSSKPVFRTALLKPSDIPGRGKP